MLTYYETASLSSAYQLLGALYDPFVLKEGVNVQFAPDELKEEMEKFQEIQDAYFEYKIEKRLRRFKAAIYQMKLATRKLIKEIENYDREQINVK